MKNDAPGLGNKLHEDRAEITPVSVESAKRLAADMAAIDPWARLGIGAEQLFRALDPGVAGQTISTYQASRNGEPVGVVSYRSDWLYGPYIRLLAVLPGAQGHGIGRLLIETVTGDAAAGGDANVWVCASAFNERALAFYERLGFQRVGVLPGLVVAHEAEILLRFVLTATEANQH